jgi:isopenicillin N synthase-like dioxygenase
MTIAEPQVANIPIIDLSVLQGENVSQAQLDEVVKQVRYACKNIGFFQIINHGISPELQRGVFQASKKFFELPMSEKMTLKRDPYGNRGYEVLEGQTLEGAVEGHLKVQSEYSGMDLKEGYYVGKERSPGDPMLKKRFNGPNKWPAAVPEFSNAMAQYYDTMYNLAVKVMELIALYSISLQVLMIEPWDSKSRTSWTLDSAWRE